jgi:hypothetical protein
MSLAAANKGSRGIVDDPVVAQPRDPPINDSGRHFKIVNFTGRVPKHATGSSPATCRPLRERLSPTDAVFADGARCTEESINSAIRSSSSLMASSYGTR